MYDTLHLNLRKKWFDMILNGIKLTEYRSIKTYYLSRIVDFKTMHWSDKQDFYEASYGYPEELANDIINHLQRNEIDFLPYKTITFSNGMKPIDILPRFEIELKNIEIDTGKPEWGAKDQELYFCLNLGEILNKKNC